MLRVVVNIDAGNNDSKCTFIMTLIKREKLVCVLVILYIREYLCVFTKLLTGIRRFSISGIRLPKTHSLNNVLSESFSSPIQKKTVYIGRLFTCLVNHNAWAIYLSGIVTISADFQ